MIIDDDRSLAEYHALILQNHGMMTKVLTQPEQLLDVIAEFNPEILILDMYMPICNGKEIATIVRQIDRFLSLPIIFLSSEKQIHRQMDAMKTGADEFIMKPVSEETLVSVIQNRIARSRLLASYMVKDSLTGLLNHAVSMERFTSLVALNQRNKRPISVAMLDLDFFKKINDNYGHSAGDIVLKSFSGILKQRLRCTDVIGRYGGEEFIVVFSDTSIENTLNILNEIREDFSSIIHHKADQSFTVTFSCGVADLHSFNTADSMMEAADEALYLAKQRGRNQVVVAALSE